MLFQPKVAWAASNTWTGVCVSPTDSSVPTIQGLQCLIANVLSVSLTLLGIAGFIMLVWGALQWQLSGGDSQATQKAGKTMLFAFAGLVLALSSFIILNVVADFTGVKSILHFVVPTSDTNWQ